MIKYNADERCPLWSDAAKPCAMCRSLTPPQTKQETAAPFVGAAVNYFSNGQDMAS